MGVETDSSWSSLVRDGWPSVIAHEALAVPAVLFKGVTISSLDFPVVPVSGPLCFRIWLLNLSADRHCSMGEESSASSTRVGPGRVFCKSIKGLAPRGFLSALRIGCNGILLVILVLKVLLLHRPEEEREQERR